MKDLPKLRYERLVVKVEQAICESCQKVKEIPVGEYRICSECYFKRLVEPEP